MFKITEVANLNEEEMKSYETSLKDKRDWKNAIDTALLEQKLQLAKRMKNEKIDMESISRVTGLSIEEISKL